MRACHSQDDATVRVEWGPAGAGSLVRYAAERGPVVAVVVDVLSFTTSVVVGVEAGMTVWPYRWRDERAAGFAAAREAVLAVSRPEARLSGGVSLSPASVAAAAGAVSRVVLPSPNGSAISALLAESGAAVAAGSLRNATAAGRWVVDRLDELANERAGEPAVVLVPAGERWEDESLRPAVEDLWGAGAVLDAIVTKLDHRAGPLLLSPEAEVALGAWLGVQDRVRESLERCASGRELIEGGWAQDVALAGDVAASLVVPVLVDGAFVNAGDPF